MLALVGCVIVVGAAIALLSPAITQVTQLFEQAGISSSYISIIFKAMAVCFITQIACDICHDSGENAIASAAELWGRATVTLMSLPLITAVIETITDFL